MKDNEKILVLHMVRELEVGGIQSLIMNIYNNIDRDKIQFDFLTSADGVLDSNFENMGSTIHHIPYITKVGPIKYKKELKKFFETHKEYKILHLHFDQLSGLIAEVARKCGVEIIISHAHIINNSTNIIGKIYKKTLQNKLLKNVTNYLACSKKAANWLFKRKSLSSFDLNINLLT